MPTVIFEQEKMKPASILVLTAGFWMLRNAPLRDIQKTAARETTEILILCSQRTQRIAGSAF